MELGWVVEWEGQGGVEDGGRGRRGRGRGLMSFDSSSLLRGGSVGWESSGIVVEKDG